MVAEAMLVVALVAAEVPVVEVVLVDLEAEVLEVVLPIHSSLTRRVVGVVVVEVTGRKGSSFPILLVTHMRKTVLIIQVELQ